MTSLPKWALGALALLGLSIGMAAPAQAYYGHRGGGVSIAFGDPYSGVYVQVPIGHRYHHRRHHPSYYYGGYRPRYAYGYGYGYHPYTYYQPPHYRHFRGHHPRWRNDGWRHHRRHGWHHRHYRGH